MEKEKQIQAKIDRHEIAVAPKAGNHKIEFFAKDEHGLVSEVITGTIKTLPLKAPIISHYDVPETGQVDQLLTIRTTAEDDTRLKRIVIQFDKETKEKPSSKKEDVFESSFSPKPGNRKFEIWAEDEHGLVSEKIEGRIKIAQPPVEEPITQPEPSSRRLTEEDITEKQWRFGRMGGPVIASKILLLSGGKVEAYKHRNESRWGIENGQVVFYNVHGSVSTRFTSVETRDGGLYLNGTFLFDNRIIHYLQEILAKPPATEPPEPTLQPETMLSGCSELGRIETDGTGDNHTKKKGGTYLRVNTKHIADSDTFRIEVDSGEFKYVTVHARSTSGSWRTIYQGDQRVFPVAEEIRKYTAQSSINEIIFSINGGHETYEPIACEARVVKCVN